MNSVYYTAAYRKDGQTRADVVCPKPHCQRAHTVVFPEAGGADRQACGEHVLVAEHVPEHGARRNVRVGWEIAELDLGPVGRN